MENELGISIIDFWRIADGRHTRCFFVIAFVSTLFFFLNMSWLALLGVGVFKL